MCFGGDGAAEKMANKQRADEEARQRRINQGMGLIDRAFSGFDNDFYSRRAQDYVDYAMPTVDREAQDTRRKLIFALSRTGNLDSSAAIDQNSDLTRRMDEARVNVANKGLDIANRTRADVENARGGVVSQLHATGDSEAAAAAALRQSQNLNMPQGFSPMGAMFADFAQALGSIGSNAGNGYSGFMGGGRSLFSNNGGSARVVG